MAHSVQNFEALIDQLEGFSEKQLRAHFTLYEGYVKKINEIEEKLQKMDPSGGNYSFNEYSELKRREAVPFNGAYLHELYFSNLAAPGQTPSEKFKTAATQAFGSWDKFIADLRGCAASTPGWVLTTWSQVDKKLHNYILFEHHLGLPVHQHVVLALDCWEHAYMIDYGITKAKYLDAFLANVCWKTVEDRLSSCGAK